MYALSPHQMQSLQIMSCLLLVSTTLKVKFSVVGTRDQEMLLPFNFPNKFLFIQVASNLLSNCSLV